MIKPRSPAKGFSQKEFSVRCQRAQAAMYKAKLDALLLTSEADFRYFSGFQSPFWQSPTRPWFLLLPAQGKPVAVIPSIGESALAATWLDDIRSWASPNPIDEGISLLADTICEVITSKAMIGLPMGPESHLRLPLNDYARLQHKLPKIQFVDDKGLVRKLRQIKSDVEIEKIHWVCQAVSGVFEALPETLSPGMSVAEVFRDFKISCLHSNVDEVNYLVGGAEPDGYNDIISAPSKKPLSAGDILMLDTGCTYDGYFCDFDRNYALGPSSPEVIDAQHRLWDATEAAFEAIQPGMRCKQIFRVMQDVLVEKPGSGAVGRFGHGLGSELTETPSFAGFDETSLKENMVMTLEPSLSLSHGKMLVHEENILITASGARWLTRRAPRDMPVVNGF